jgi:uncharacterized protein (TIGR03790 family)
MNSAWLCGAVVAALPFAGARALAGGSGLNTVVVVNQASTNSVQLGNYYCERRGVPPQNVLRITWNGGPVAWTRADFESLLRSPLEAMLAARGLTNQVDYVVLSMDIPYRVIQTNDLPLFNGVNSTTAALFYGFKPDGCLLCPGGLASCNLPSGSTSAYAGSEGVFRQTPPVSATSNSWLVMMLTSSNLAGARAIVDRGVAADFTFPTQTVALAKSPTDRLRRIRGAVFDSALLNARIRGGMTIVRTNVASPLGLGTLFGYAGGDQVVSLTTNIFAPGAMADSLTSFGGYLFENSGHTDALDFLNAGATASYGTVIEPCAYLAKFPNAQNFFYQARGFSIAESYYQSVTNPYQGVLVGEPLSAPFAQPGSSAWLSLPEGALLAGVTNLALQFDAADPTRPLQQVDLFVDGLYTGTLTNIAPRQSNVLWVTLNGVTTNYVVPAGATLKSIASNLAVRLNAAAYTNQTKVRAFAVGDRIQLQSFDLTRLGEDTTLAVSNSPGSAPALTTFLHAGRSQFLDRVVFGIRGYLITNALVTVPSNAYLQCVVIKTNGDVVTVAVTNTVDGAPFNAFAKSFLDAIQTNALLTGADGIAVEDVNMHEDEPYRTFVYGTNDHSGEFNLSPRSPGWPEAQVQVALSGSSGFTIWDAGTNRLDKNLPDLQPRNHIYVTAGVTNLALTFPLNTTPLADGWHELTAVAYEGSHVRTQTRVSRTVRVQNTPLSATFTCLLCDTNTALEATLQFLVEANTNTISRIELFSTGGGWGTVSNQPSAAFSLAATNLGVGRHPFYAVVTRTDGRQYRTETKWIRILGDEPPFALSIAAGAPTLTWPATAGRRYEVLSAHAVTGAYTLRDTLVPTNSPAQWAETNNAVEMRFYRVRAVP